MRSGVFNNIVMGSDSSEDYFIVVPLKGKPVEHCNTALPYIFVTFHLFYPERWMGWVLNEKFYLFFKGFSGMLWKVSEVLLKGICSGNLHSYRSFIRSSTEEKLFVLPCLISSSACLSAFDQSNSLKYGGRQRAYLSSSITTDSSSGRSVVFLYSCSCSKSSSGSSKVMGCFLSIKNYTTKEVCHV